MRKRKGAAYCCSSRRTIQQKETAMAQISRPTNMRRELRENVLLLGLLICAIDVSFGWIVGLLEQQ